MRAGFEGLGHHFGRARRPAAPSSLVSSWVRTRIGTSVRSSRTDRRMRNATSGLAKVMTTTAGVGEADVFQDLYLTGVAVDHRIAGLAPHSNPVRIDIERDVFEAGLFEHAGDILSHAPESADHHVVALGRSQGPWVSRIASVSGLPDSRRMMRVMRRLWRMISGDRTMLRTVAASSGCTMAGSSSSLRSNSDQQGEAKFSALRDDDSGAQRFEPALGGGFGGQRDDGRFQQQHAEKDRRHQRQIAQQQADIEQHADGDEEQAQAELPGRSGSWLPPDAGIRFRPASCRRERRPMPATGLLCAWPRPMRARPAAPPARTVRPNAPTQ